MKEKKCKGTGKAKGFGCGDLVSVRRYGLCFKCWKVFLLSDQGESTREKYQLKAKKKVEKESKEKISKMKSDSTNWLQKCQSKVQEIVRLIDYGQPCTAHPDRKPFSFQAQGGHVHSKGLHPECRLNLHNIHIQSAQSNKWQNDDGLMREGLKRIYGEDYLSFVDGLTNKPIVKHSDKEYEQIYKIACKIATELKKKGETYDKLQRLMLRNKINQQLGIYPDDRCLFDSFDDLPF